MVVFSVLLVLHDVRRLGNTREHSGSHAGDEGGAEGGFLPMDGDPKRETESLGHDLGEYRVLTQAVTRPDQP
jgi:hypothetical protein